MIKECHYNVLQFEMKSEDLTLSYVFSKLEEAQKDLNIEDYSVSQNTLDNVSNSGRLQNYYAFSSIYFIVLKY